MNTTELIEIARECGASIGPTSWILSGEKAIFDLPEELQQFAKRIEQPHKQRIAELEKELETERSELMSLESDIQCYENDETKLNEQIAQLKEALQALYDEQNGPPLIRDAERWEAAMQLSSKALEETK